MVRRRNLVAVLGGAASGKSHLITELGATLEIRTKYCEADVAVEEVRAGAAVPAEARAWVVVVAPCADAFAAMKEQLAAAMDTVPDRRLLVVNEAAPGAPAAADFARSDAVFEWCMAHQFEAVPRAYAAAAPAPLPPARRAALLSMRLLDVEAEPTGAARVFQALACTLWPSLDKAAKFEAAAAAAAAAEEVAFPSAAEPAPNENRVLLVYSEAEGVPKDVVEALGMGTGELRIVSKYYTAQVAVHLQPVEAWGEAEEEEEEDRASPYHAVIAVFRSEAALAKHTARLPQADVGVLLGVGEAVHGDGAGGAPGLAWEWAVGHGYEVVTLPTAGYAGAAAAGQGLGDRIDEEATVRRVRDALEATMWPDIARGGEAPKKTPAPAAHVDAAAVETASTAGAAAAVGEAVDTRRWRNRWASGVEGARGCEVPPGWILDKVTKRSRPLRTMEERVGKGGAESDGGEASDSDDNAEDYDTLLKEAMFLRHQGRTLGPDERQERAAEVAMRMMGMKNIGM